MRYVLALLTCVILSSSANALSGMDLLRDCSQADEFTNSEHQSHAGVLLSFARCLGYLEGVIDTNQLMSRLKGGPPAFFCDPPNGIQTEQAMLVVLKYLLDNPRQLHKSARINVVAALRGAFPCSD
jgi:hypothetical protein